MSRRPSAWRHQSSAGVERWPSLGLQWVQLGIPHPSPELRGGAGGCRGGDSAVGRPQTPGEGADMGGRGGELASAPGERQDQQRRRRSRGPPKQDVASSFRTRPFGAPGLWGRGGARRGRGAPRAPASRGGAPLLGAEGPHPGLKSPPGPRGREGGRARGRPLVLLLPGVVRGALTRAGTSLVQKPLSERLPRARCWVGKLRGDREKHTVSKRLFGYNLENK